MNSGEPDKNKLTLKKGKVIWTICSFTKKRNSSHSALLCVSDIYPLKMNVQVAGIKK